MTTIARHRAWFCVLLVAATTALGQSPVVTATRLSDGPHLFHQPDGSVRAIWVDGGKTLTRTFAKGQSIKLPEFAPLLGPALALRTPTTDPAVWKMPERLLLLSDVEGEFTTLVRFLKNNKVIDDKDRWCFGKGHLAAIGDMVDRGDRVTEVLWLMYRLHREAEAAGGRLHFVLGNHEAMIMGGDTRYIAPKYRQISQLLGKPYEALVGADTELGRWLRQRNSIVKIGAFVLVHGGIAPSLAVRADGLDAFNDTMRGILGQRPEHLQRLASDAKAPGGSSARQALELGWGMRGPYWYRGYFQQYATAYAEDFGPLPTEAQLDAVLARLLAKTIVVGHTKVKRPTFLFGRRVLAIDTPWTDPAGVRGILIESGGMTQVDVDGRRQSLPRQE